MSEHTSVNRVIQLIELKRPREAEKIVREGLMNEPEDSDLHALLALCLRDQDRMKDALESAQAAVRYDPQSNYAHYIHCACLFRMERYPEAIKAIERSLAIDNQDEEYHYFHGISHLAMGHETKGRESLKKALELNPQYEGALGMLAQLDAYEGKHDQAQAYVNQALAADPESMAGQVAHSITLLETGQHKEAREAILKVMRRHPESRWVRATLKEVLKKTSPAYRGLFGFLHKTSRASKKSRWTIFFVVYAIIKIFRYTVKFDPRAWWVVGPLVGGYILFWTISWQLEPLSCFFLLIHPLGRPLLVRKEILAGLVLVILLPVGILLITASLASNPGILGSIGLIITLFALVAAPRLAKE